MITISELLTKLAYGELRNLSIVPDDAKGTIREDDIPTILNYANDALTHLFSKFVLLQNDIGLVTVEPIVKYYIRKEFAAVDQPHSTTKYLDDSLNHPFNDEFLKILAVFSENGCELPLNDSEQCDSLHTYEYDCLQVPKVYLGTRLSVIYQAKHPKLLVDDLEQKIHIPFYLEVALRSYIAGKFLSHMNGEEHTAKGQEHLSNYYRICSEVKQEDIAITSISTTNNKLEKRGFV